MSESTQKLKTVPFDPRFPNQNQTQNCYRNYIDYHRCMDLLDGNPKCDYFLKVYTTLCPNSWVEKWDQQREDGTFPGVIVRVPKVEDVIAAQAEKEQANEEEQKNDEE